MDRTNTTPVVVVAMAVSLLCAEVLCPERVAAANGSNAATGAVFARVNGKAVSAALLNAKIEELYPTASVHGKPGGSPELRQKAVEAVILEELIWQQAVRAGKVVPLAEAQRARLRLRSPKPAVNRVRRALTIQRARKQHVELPAQVPAAAVRAYYDENTNRFRRPDRVRIRLILVAVDAKASAEEEREAKKKADGLYAQLKAGKDFGELAWESSDDMYRVKGGDVGWMHKGSMDKEFEPIAFSLPVGQVTAPFRIPLGYSILKVEAREPARQMTFEEVRDKLKQQLTAINTKRLEQAWEAALKKDATIEILDANAGTQPMAAAPMASH